MPRCSIWAALVPVPVHLCMRTHAGAWRSTQPCRPCCHCAYTICTWQQISHSHLLKTLASFTGQEKKICCHTQNTTIHAMCYAQRAACSTVGGVSRVTLQLPFPFPFLSMKENTVICQARKRGVWYQQRHVWLLGAIGSSQHLGPMDGVWGFNHATTAMDCHIWLLDEENWDHLDVNEARVADIRHTLGWDGVENAA